MIKHLVTSGCSFSDNIGMRWPHYLSKSLSMHLYNRGQGSAGNHWIAKSSIYQTQLLLDKGIDPKEILVTVMWSGIDRKDSFVDAEGTIDYKKLINDPNNFPNPVSFLDNDHNTNNKQSTSNTDGYLLGSASCVFSNEHIVKFKRDLTLRFFSPQSLAIESYENFLRLQWFCKSSGIQLINQTFMDIMHYPNQKNILTKDFYRNIKPLYDMIDFDDWIFYNNTSGLFEYVKDHGLDFEADKLHPRTESHKIYVEDFLIPTMKERKVL